MTRFILGTKNGLDLKITNVHVKNTKVMLIDRAPTFDTLLAEVTATKALPCQGRQDYSGPNLDTHGWLEDLPGTLPP